MYRKNNFAAEKKIQEQAEIIDSLKTQIETFRLEKEVDPFNAFRKTIGFFFAISACILLTIVIIELPTNYKSRVIYVTLESPQIEYIKEKTND